MLKKFHRSFSLHGPKISLAQILEAREQRNLRMAKYLCRYRLPLLSLTINAVGEVKKNAMTDYLFEKSLEKLTALFQQLALIPTKCRIYTPASGQQALFILPTDAEALKKAVIMLEQESYLGRLWDIDVIAADGIPLSRQRLGFPPRSCLLCRDEAKICARSGRHSQAELNREMQRRTENYAFAEQIASLAIQALRREVRLTPKPGLVDQANNGAHRDMNLQSFERSATALFPFFIRFILIGIQTAARPESEILALLRPLGIRAEQAMLQASGGINTHKGAIFAFGLICAAIGRSHILSADKTLNIESLCHTAAGFCQGISLELSADPQPAQHKLSAGMLAYRRYGLRGARGEAERGFPLAQKALVQLGHLKRNPHTDQEHRLLIALLYIMAHNDDTNLVRRGGPDGLRFVRRQTATLLKQRPVYQDKAFLQQQLREFDRVCIQRNLSPGGSADLLALTIFFDSLMR
ncbi:holo-ACP synthase/triphosphoribosyl-dephospho-CoA synthase [Mesocricetibacter intestinalis]|uniref:Probable 2-(5''-triphosphoribosyl)-3'-dephosphocoenzyme-A synthase n=1 Tax=Mesocricetibacter intestinalis TaxID=1521930 RepID=A0A4R6VBZ7_9PAST|nr:triphosphoribosyl-dephospho-CoA synthase CitG [Mesocricetibacter intestinalis]TDQ59404.1 holo-ACP synthase/triphosphoribosyl-dephospho-CoA synthase [Mesocricetibacter intestinalis]